MPRTLEIQEKEGALDDFHRHEALDRVSVWLDHFSAHIADHPVISGSPDLSARCEEITDLCGALYQAISQKTHEIDSGKS